MTTTTGTTADLAAPVKAAVLGSPIAHSLSPALHAAAYRALGLAGWTYTAHRVEEAGLAAFLVGLDDTWAGLSLTMPLKQAVIALLDDVDDVVRSTGSCNTVVFGPPGHPGERPGRRGHNTDVDGIVAALAEVGVTTARSPVVLGAGATAASAVTALARLGATTAVVGVRTVARAAAVVRAGAASGVTCEVRGLPDDDVLDRADVVISTLPPGAADPVAARLGHVSGTLLDVVYRPWPTALATAWTALGGTVVAGQSMLLHQAARQVSLMTGHPAPVEAMRAALATDAT